MKNNIKIVLNNLKNSGFDDYLYGKTVTKEYWEERYLTDPERKMFASGIVWEQENHTFTVQNDNLIDCNGNGYALTDKAICYAHVMDMTDKEIDLWREYFKHNDVRQPFDQTWENKIEMDKISKDRYSNISLNFKYFMNKSKHGIHFRGGDWSDIYADLSIADDSIIIKTELDDDKDEHFFITDFEAKKQNRISNHVINLFDKWTVFGRISKNDLTVMQYMDQYNVAQITEFIDIASKNQATELSAALIQYKNEKYPDYDSFDEFSLDMI